jgi:hypothetical protein
MNFVYQGDRAPKGDNLPCRLIIVTLLELVGYGLIAFLIGSIIGPVLLSHI